MNYLQLALTEQGGEVRGALSIVGGGFVPLEFVKPPPHLTMESSTYLLINSDGNLNTCRLIRVDGMGVLRISLDVLSLSS